MSMVFPVLLSSFSVSVFAGNDFEEAFYGAIKTVYLRMFLCTRTLLCPEKLTDIVINDRTREDRN
jgi:outer membrane usher protein